MKVSEKYFLAVAQELNISKAAKQLYLSQQDLSKHIRKLEKELGAELFYRKPVFMLSPYGEALKASLEQISVIEQGREQRFQEIHNESIGTIRFGIHFTRSRIILPHVYTAFNRLYPQVQLSLFNEESGVLTRKLLRGEIDVMLAVNTPMQPEMREEYITTENIFLLIPASLFAQQFGKNAPKIRRWFLEEGADLAMLQDLPFIANDATSQAQQVIDNYLLEHAISLRTSLHSTDHYGNIYIAGIGSHMCCCPQTILDAANDFNQGKSKTEQLQAYRIGGLGAALRISLFIHRDRFVPRYLSTFLQIVKDECLQASLRYAAGLPG